MATAAERFTEWTNGLRYDDIPTEVCEAAKLHLLDTLGCGLAAHALGVATEGRTTMAELGGAAQATVVGLDAGLPAPNAAFANAMLCHGLDFDDTHSDSVSHVSTVTCPAALAAGEAQGASGREVLTAIVGANEVVTRLGMAASGEFHRRGFHPTAICGIFGAVTAAARLDGLDARAATSAFGLVGSMASGLFAYLEDGTATKPLHPAWAAHGALIAARLASLGAEGPPSLVEGKFGLYHAFLGAEKGTIDVGSQLADLGSRWETPRIAYKPYPACHFMHGSLGATSQAAGGRTFSAEEIEDVVVTVPAAGVSLVLEPADAKVAPRSDYEGKFSLQYSTAVDARPRQRRRRRLHRRGDLRPGRARGRRQGALRDEGLPDLPAGLPGRSPGAARRRHFGRGRLPLPEGRARRTRSRRARCARSFAATRRSRCSDTSLEALEARDSGARGARRPAFRARTARRRRGRRRMTVDGLSDEQREIVAAVGEFVDREVIPVASDLEHADEFPEALVAQMREMGLFGVTIPEEYGGLGLSLDTYALIVMELSRGWVTLSGIVNGSFIAGYMIRMHGTDEQKERYLPLLAARVSFAPRSR